MKLAAGLMHNVEKNSPGVLSFRQSRYIRTILRKFSWTMFYTCSPELHSPQSYPMFFRSMMFRYKRSLAFKLSLLCFALCLPVYGQAAIAVKSHKAKSKKTIRQAKAAPALFRLHQSRPVAEFIDEISERNDFDREVLRNQFARVHFQENVIRLINPPPATKAKNWSAYKQRFIEPVRIKAGMEFWSAHEQTLARAESIYGVPAEIIIGILGVETMYGRMAGKIRVMDALTTLAFAYPNTPNREARMQYFRSELEQTLLYARENNLDPFSLSGSFAGAIGWPQFMPGSIRKFAVDFDGDGKIDLRNSADDAIGSVASFLSQHGWQNGVPLIFPAQVAASESHRWRSFLGQGLEAKFMLHEFDEAGVNAEHAPLYLLYGLVDLQDGDRPDLYWLGTMNFFAITKYNRSFFYAMSVIELGNAVKQQRTP